MSRLFIRDPLFGGKQPMISPPRKGYQQDALFAANEVERQKRVLRAKVFLAANVYQQDELRALKESSGASRRKKSLRVAQVVQ